MIVFPAVDIRGGKCVRLEEGDFARETVFEADPVEAALRFEREGARWLHVVDLDGARGEGGDNADMVLRIARAVRIPVQTGGGIRDMARIGYMLEGGVRRVVLGTAAVADPTFLRDACRRYPGAVAVSIDVRDGRMAVEGWRRVEKVRDVEFLERIRDMGVSAVVYTDISRDGKLEGANIEGILRVQARTDIPLIASGGISSVEEVRRLHRAGIYGVIIGKALYTGKLSLDGLRGLMEESPDT